MRHRSISVRAKFATLLVLAVAGFSPAVLHATTLYSDDFSSDTSSNYNVNVTAGATGPSGDATFVYNYGAAPGSGGLSIPVAPHTTDGSTTGLRIRTDNLQSSVGSVVGATEVVTKGLSLPSQYTVQADVWCNYIGSGSSIASSGTNGSTGAAVGIGSAGGSTLQYIAGNDGYIAEGFGDTGGGANGAYRVYVDNTTRPTPANSNYFPSATTTFNDPYYTAFLPSVAAPAGQQSFAATQGGSSTAGTLGFGWHTWKIIQDGTSVVWEIDDHTIAYVPDSALTFGGSQVSLSNDDTGLTGSSATNNQLFNAQIFDNLIITDVVPEPGTLAIAAMATGLILGRRRA